MNERTMPRGMTRGEVWAARVLLALVATAVVMVAFAPAARAAGVDGDEGVPLVTFSVPWTLVIALLVSTVLPLLVGLVTKLDTNSGRRAVILAGLAALTGLLSELGASLGAGRPYDLGVGLLAALAGFLVAVGMHFGLYKPTGLADRAQAVGDPSAH